MDLNGIKQAIEQCVFDLLNFYRTAKILKLRLSGKRFCEQIDELRLQNTLSMLYFCKQSSGTCLTHTRICHLPMP